MAFSFPAVQGVTASAQPIPCRKRKDYDEEDDYQQMQDDVAVGMKGARRGIDTDASNQQAQFHPLPRELNLQLLANLGYNVNNQNQSFESIRQHGAMNHSPSSSASDFCPSTPNDVLPTSAESYFTKGMQSEAGSSPAYPIFNIYPEHNSPRPSGLLGVYMQEDSMDVDDQHKQAGPSHGPHCKSIPQLNCRGNGPTKELWANCLDCGTMSRVDCPRFSAPLCYSP